MGEGTHRYEDAHAILYCSQLEAPDTYIITEAVDDAIPDELDDEELAEYAATQELLDGLCADDVFSYSDIDDVPPIGHENEEQAEQTRSSDRDDVEMDF